MNLDNKHRIVSWLLALAFALPILIKVEHLLLPNHDHYCHSCHNAEAKTKDICEILAFDYFFFVPSDTLCIPKVSVFEFQVCPTGYSSLVVSETKFGYSLRAPPANLKHII